MKQQQLFRPYLFFRRAIELTAISFFSPLILSLALLTAILVSVNFGRQIFFTQNRIGRGGRTFKMYKFKSMKPAAPGSVFTLTAEIDPRVTCIGRFIRRTRLDELPQFYNILRGDMSLIGPRPVPSDLYEKYKAEIPNYDRRHLVSPGITGFAQVTQGYTNSTDGEREKWRRDVFYIENLSPVLDADIVWQTLKTVAMGFV